MSPLLVKDRTILEKFDRTDLANMGRPLYWSLDNHIIALEQMICADEIEIALSMFEQIPAWYREPQNYPEELVRLKKLLYQNMYDQYDYAADDEEAGYTRENAEAQWGTNYTFPRAEVLRETIYSFNQVGKTPWYFEASPSHGLLPLGLAKEKHKFKFFGKNLNQLI